MECHSVPGSFRDPSGHLFFKDGVLYRQVNQCYQKQYNHLIESGLYDDLISLGLLIPHEEAEVSLDSSNDIYKLLMPEILPFVSYPYEWCFSQLKDAALATLRILDKALSHGMILKDASAYNIQFIDGRPVLIDTLSFDEYAEGCPWVAYKQFCQHFLTPLMMMSTVDIRFNQLFRIYIDGIPLDLASKVLPFRTKLSFSSLLHIHMHAASQAQHSDRTIDKSKFKGKVSKQSLLGLIDSLKSSVTKLQWTPKGTEWVDYYDDDSYSADALDKKKQLVIDYLNIAEPKRVWDLGGNTGVFSRIARDNGAETISFDVDPACVEVNYREVVKNGEKNLLPLLLDLTNPSPGIGWDCDERMTLSERGPVDLIMALALIHHLAISNNVPLVRISEFLASLCKWLIIEFVPKSDPKVIKLLATREDVFPDYTQQGFEESFKGQFDIQSSCKIASSERVLYLMRSKQ